MQNAKPTGSPSEGDIFNPATAVYNDLATFDDMYKYFGNSTLKVGKPFLYLNCYKWLEGTYLWKMIVEATTKRSEKSSCDVVKSEKEGSVSPDEGKRSQETKSSVAERRPVGAKRAATQAKQLSLLERGGVGIEGLAGESKKKNEIAAKLLELEKRNSRISLFQMEGTSQVVREKFLEYEQNRVLLEMELEQKAIEREAKRPRIERETTDTGVRVGTGGSHGIESLVTTATGDENGVSEEEYVAGAIVFLSSLSVSFTPGGGEDPARVFLAELQCEVTSGRAYA